MINHRSRSKKSLKGKKKQAMMCSSMVSDFDTLKTEESSKNISNRHLEQHSESQMEKLQGLESAKENEQHIFNINSVKTELNIEPEEPLNCLIRTQEDESVKNTSFEHMYIKQEIDNCEDVHSSTLCKEAMDENVEEYCVYNTHEDVEFSVDSVKTEIDTTEMESVAINDSFSCKSDDVLNEDKILKVKAPSRTYQRTMNRKRQIPSWGRDEPEQSTHIKQETVDVNKQLPQINISVENNINCENEPFKCPRLTLKSSNISSQFNNITKSKKLFNYVKQFHQCLFCKMKFTKVFKHFVDIHNSQFEVRNVLNMPKTKHLQQFNFLKRVGDFQCNVHSLKNEDDKLIVLRLSERFLGKSRPEEFLPCPDCTGFLHKTQLFRHYRKCIAKKSRHVPVTKKKLLKESRLLLRHALLSVDKFIPHFFLLSVGDFLTNARNDRCLFLLEKQMIKIWSHTDDVVEVMARRMMQRMGCLLMSCRRIANDHTLSMREILIPDNVNLLTVSVKTMLLSETENVQKLELITDLFSKITSCVYILRSGFLLESNLSKADEHSMFYYKFLETWERDVGGQEVNKMSDLPLMSDVINLKEALESRIIKLTNEIKVSKKRYINDVWLDLAESTLCLLCMFNAAEFSSVELLKVSEYAVRPDWSVDEVEDFKHKLSNFTYFLAAKRFLVCMNFYGNKCVLLFTKIIKKAIDVLISNRHRTFISSKNEFVFASLEGAKGCFRSVNCFYNLCIKTGYLNYNIIRDFKKRRYLSFLTRIIDMSSEETTWAMEHFQQNEKVFKKSCLNFKLEDEVYQAYDIWRMHLKEVTDT